MYEQMNKPQHTVSPPLQMKTDDYLTVAKKSKSRNPYEGAPIRVSGALANRIRDSFGIQANELKLRESPQVAEMGARATAQGDAIRFAPGEFRPDTSEGMAVLGHELSHIRAQAEGNVRANVPGSDIHYDARHEAVGDMAGEAFASGGLSASGPVSLAGSSACGAPVQGIFGWAKKLWNKVRGRGNREARYDTSAPDELEARLDALRRKNLRAAAAPVPEGPQFPPFAQLMNKLYKPTRPIPPTPQRGGAEESEPEDIPDLPDELEARLDALRRKNLRAAAAPVPEDIPDLSDELDVRMNALKKPTRPIPPTPQRGGAEASAPEDIPDISDELDIRMNALKKPHGRPLPLPHMR